MIQVQLPEISVYQQDHQQTDSDHLQIVQEKGSIHLIFPAQANPDQCRLFLNGTPLETDHFELHPEEKAILSYELKDLEGNVLESAEKELLYDPIPPQIETDCERILVYEQAFLNSTIHDSQLMYAKASIDGEEVEWKSQIQILPGMQRLELFASDSSGNCSQREILIRSFDVTPSWNEDTTVLAHETLELKLDGDWHGMQVRIITDKDEMILPFDENGHCSFSLENDAQIVLIHEDLQERIAWNLNITKPGNQPDEIQEENTESTEKLPVTEVVNPEKEVITPPTENQENRPPAPVVSPTPLPVADARPHERGESSPVSESVASKEEVISFSQPVPPDLTESLLPAKPVEVSIGKEGVLHQMGQTVWLTSLEQFTLNVSQGEIASTKVVSLETGQSYSSLVQAMNAENNPAVEFEVALSDEWGNEETASWILLPQLEAVQTSHSLNGTALENQYVLKAGGDLKIESAISYRPPVLLCQGFEQVNAGTLQAGKPYRLYVDDPSRDLTLVMNGQSMDVVLQEDELGQSYFSIWPQRGTSDFAIMDGDQAIWSESIEADAAFPFHLATGVAGGMLVGLGMFVKRKRYAS